MFGHVAIPGAKKAGDCHIVIDVAVFPGAGVLEDSKEMGTSAVDTTAIFQNFLGLYRLYVQGHLFVSS